MWIIVLIFLFNSAANGTTWINANRITIGGIPLGANDALPILAVVGAFLMGEKYSREFPNVRTHPALTATIVLIGLGMISGIVGALVNGVELLEIVKDIRDWLSYIFCLIGGYRLLSNPKWAYRMGYVIVIAGVFTAIGTILAFIQGSDLVAWGKGWNAVRTVAYVTSYSTVGAALGVYSIINKNCRLFPLPLAAFFACFSILGLFAPMTRGEWLGGAFTLICLLFIVRPEYRMQFLTRSLIFAPLMFGTLAFGVWGGGKLTGKDFAKKVWQRVESMVPSEGIYIGKGDSMAWESRSGSIRQEVQIWLQNPLFGRGLAIQEQLVIQGEIGDTRGYNHNGWSSLLAKTGILGFAGFMLMTGSMLVLGRRIVKQSSDPGSIMIGAAGFLCGCYLIIAILTTMIWVTRDALFHALLAGMVFRVRDWQATVEQRQAESDIHDETWLYEHGRYDSEGNWLSPSQADVHV